MNRALALLTVAAASFTLWHAGAGLAPEAPSSRWVVGGPAVPTEIARLAGALRPRGDALDLWSYRSATARTAPFREGSIRVDAVVPSGGQLVVAFGEAAGPARPMLPPPQGAPHRPPPGPAAPSRAVIVDRGARASVVGRGLPCAAIGPALPASRPDAMVLDLVVRGAELQVSVDNEPALRCQVDALPPGLVTIGSGVRRVQVERVAIEPREGSRFTHDFGVVWRTTTFGALLALGIAAATVPLALRYVAAGRPTRATLAALVLLLGPPLCFVDLRGTLDALRLLAVPEALGPTLFAVVPGAVGVLLALSSGDVPLRAALALGAAPLAVVAATAVAARATGGGADAFGWLILAMCPMVASALVWVNTHPSRHRVALSYAAVLLVLVLAELGVRRTSLDESWSVTEGWRRASEEFAELLELRRHRAYPDEGFPVRPPEPDGRPRIVALGGSSTGGAFQMDDLDQFWPRALQDRLNGRWQVVNQGVGGWNTLHVRLYLESQIERLGADVYVLYVGHNDILATAPRPYRELYAGWTQRASASRAVSAFLERSRLYVGLRFAVLAARDDDTRAVPVADARENLDAIVALAHGRGARVLLVNEGLNPDPGPMRPYGAMLAEIAAASGARAYDAAAAFAKEDPDNFIDDCHLSVAGHRRLAGWIEQELRTAGWIGQ